MHPEAKYISLVACAAFLAQTILMVYIIWKQRPCQYKMITAFRSEDIIETSEENHTSPVWKVTVLQGNSADLPRRSADQQHRTVDFSSEMYFEPLVQQDFLSASFKVPRIPHIIHQTYKDENIPVQFVGNIQTMMEKNPNWTYFFWTDESAKKIVAERYPQLLPMWNDYKSPINRADAIRYIALYEFGGFYGDLDIVCKRPLDNLTTKYSCIFPPEPFEQSVFRIQIPYLINNAVMLCRPKHPFLKHMIDSLHQYQSMLNKIDIAGPSFVTSQFIRYNNITADMVYKFKQSNESNSPYFYKGNLPEDDSDAVYVPNTQYFINSLSQDWMNERHYKDICAKQGTKGIIVTKACNELVRRLSQEERDKYAFTDHKWFKSYEHPFLLRTTRLLNSIVRHTRMY